MKEMLLIIWMIFTLIFICSIIGIFLMVHDYNDNRSTWMQIGLDLKEAIINKK